MREVEIKAILPDIEVFIRALSERGAKFLSKLIQYDRIFIQNGKAFLDLENGSHVFRIREVNETLEFNLKISGSNQLDCIEYELRIDNSQMMESILKSLGYSEVISVRKEREIYKLEDLTINIDIVDGLGSFIEIERLVDENDTSDFQTLLKQKLVEIYPQPVKFVNKGYDTLLFQQQKF